MSSLFLISIFCDLFYILICNLPKTTQTGGNKSIVDWAEKSTGEFKRQASIFRNSIPSADFPAEADRYHLYVSYACPWAHRTLIVRKLKGLETILSYTSVHWYLGEKGWKFQTSSDGKTSDENLTSDPLHPGYTHLREIYHAEDPDYSLRFTVPVLYDKKAKKIVSNESSDIIRMMYTAFDHLLSENYKNVKLLPKEFKSQIEESNEWIYNDINNGVYKSGFATEQSAYESAVETLFSSLDRVEAHLSKRQEENNGKPVYYYGNNVTEADVRLFTTIIRFDAVYVQHFKCNIRDIRSGYPAIHSWVRNLYWNHQDAFGELSKDGKKGTTDFTHIKCHYTRSHGQINPNGITPVGPIPHIMQLDEEVAAVSKSTRLSS